MKGINIKKHLFRPYHPGGFFQKLLLWVFRLFIIFLFLNFALFLFLQIPSVQRSISTHIKSYLENKSGTKVELDGIKFNFFNSLELSNFSIEDLHGNKVIYAKSLEINFDLNPYYLARKKIVLDELVLKDVGIVLRKYTGEKEGNIDLLIEKMFPKSPQKTETKSNLQIEIRKVVLAKVEFSDYKENTGNYLSISAESGNAIVKNINLGEKLFVFSDANFDMPVIKIQKRLPIPDKYLSSAVTTSSALTTSKSLELIFQKFNIDSGALMVDNFQHPFDVNIDFDAIDWAHFKIKDININGQNLTIGENKYQANNITLSLMEQKGFKIDNMKASFAGINNKQIRLAGLVLKTPQSLVKDSITINYESMDKMSDDFTNNVDLDIGLNHSNLAIKDIAYFAPSLKRDAFFKNNFDEILQVSGHISGKINKLNVKDLDISIPGKLRLLTDFRSNDLAKANNAILNLNIHQLTTNIDFLDKAIPGLTLPANFKKIGNIAFEGRFDGFFTDFVTFGKVKTNLGNLKLDVRMDLLNGSDKANYSGSIQLYDFNLRKWTDNDHFDKLTADLKIKNGFGFTSEKATADLKGEINAIGYNSYVYKNISLNGVFKKQTIDGVISCTDSNADFDFKGKIDFATENPSYNFISRIKNLDLYKLNLSKDPLKLSGDLNIDIITENLKTIIGTSRIKNLKLSNDQKVIFATDSIFLTAKKTGNNKQIIVKSDIANIDISGEYDVDNLHKMFLASFAQSFPRYYKDLKLPTQEDLPFANCSYKIDVFQPQPLLELLGNPIAMNGTLKLKGDFDSRTERWGFELETPDLKYKENSFDKISIKYDQLAEDGKLSGVINQSNVMYNVLPEVRFNFLINTDSIRFDIRGLEIFKSDLSMDGILAPASNGYKLKFKNKSFNLLGETWDINRDNILYFEPNRVSASFCSLLNGEKKILLNNLENNGLEFAILGYDISNLNELLDYEKVKFSGNLQIYAKVLDVYKMKNFGLVVYSDSLNLNKDYWGKFKMNCSAENFKDLVYLDYELDNDSTNMYGKGYLDISQQDNIGLKLSNKFKNLPLKTIEYFIGNGISHTFGVVTGNANLEGKLNYLNLSGKAKIENAGFHLIYTNVDYLIPDANVTLTNKMIDATGSYLIDPAGNKATITGGLVHDHFQKWGYNVKIQSPEFISLNTSLKNNNLYYGKGVGALMLTIGGSFDKTNMYINATTSKGSQLTIPFGNTEQAKAASFIRFVSKVKDTISTKGSTAKTHEAQGLSVDVDLSITEDALIQLNLDPNAGDYIKGYGKGNIQLSFSRTGQFQMFGDYEIESGEYLFTLLNLVNKPFNISRGSAVRWTGDPYEGEVNLIASYRDLYTSPYNFILEYLGSDKNAINEARNTTKVDLDLNLTGRLLSPNIKLDLNFPNISPVLRNYIDSKLRVIRQDQNEMNRQAMALIVTKTFLPPNNAFQGTQYVTSINTLSELMSNQLSGYLTQLFSDFIKNNGVISGIDFVVGYNVYDASTVNPFSTSEFQVRMKNNLFSDRLSINIGGNVGTNASSTVSSQTYFAGDLEVTYSLTADKRLKVRAYQRTEPSVEGGRKNRSGVGISYKRDFNNFSEVIDELKSTRLSKIISPINK